MKKTIIVLIIVLTIVVVHIAFQLDLLYILKCWHDVAIKAL